MASISKVSHQQEMDFTFLNITEGSPTTGENSQKLPGLKGYISNLPIPEDLNKDIEALVDVADGTYSVGKKIFNFFPSTDGPFWFLPEMVNQIFDEIYAVATSPEFSKAVENATFTITLLALPGAIKEVISKIQGAYEAIKEKDSEFIWDNILGGSYETAKLLGSASGAINYMVKIELVAQHVLKALPFLSSAGIALGSMGIVKVTINSYQLHQELKAYNIILQENKDRDACYTKVDEYVSSLSKNKAKKLFGRSQEWVLERIRNVENANDKDLVIYSLRDRISATKHKNMLDMGAGLSWLGSNIAFLFAATTIGVPYLILSAAVFSVAKDSQSWIERKNFRNVLEDVKTRSLDVR